MRYQSLTRRIFVLPVLVAGFALLLAACSSSGKPSSGPTNEPAGSASTIKANWEAFFSSSTPVSRRVALLQNGSQFQSLIAAQSKSSLASSASAKVSKVTQITATQATVAYSILVSGQSALPNQKGVAVKQNGTWKVGDKSFCGLLELEKSSGLIKITSLPAACSSAG